MLDVLKDNFYLLLYAVALVLSFAKFPKYFDSALRYFPIIIFYTFCTELLGMAVLNFEEFSFISKKGFSNYTVVIYNLYDLLFFMYFFYVFYSVTTKPKLKRILKYGAGLYFIIMVINTLFKNPMLYDMWFAYTFGALLLIFACCTYLIGLKGFSKTIIFSDMLFWVSLGCLLFHIGYTPIMILQNSESLWMEENYGALRTLHLSLIVVMYTCFIIGFLTMRSMPKLRKQQ